MLHCDDVTPWYERTPSWVMEKMRTHGVVRPRDAASILLGLTIAIEHKASYLPAFVEKLYVPIA